MSFSVVAAAVAEVIKNSWSYWEGGIVMIVRPETKLASFYYTTVSIYSDTKSE
jgi:hypothetical protein